MEPSTPLNFIKGIGDARAKAFAKLGVHTAGDLLCFFPRTYENRGNVKKLIECFNGEVVSVVVRIDSPPKEGRGKTGIFFVKTSGSDDTDTVYITFFNNKWISSSLVPGRLFRLYGRITFSPYGREIVNPVIETYTPDLPSIIPVYPQTGNLTQRVISSAIKSILPLAEKLPEVLPSNVLTQFALISKADAFKKIHFPETMEDTKQAIRRLAFEELLIFQLALSKLRSKQVIKKAAEMTQKGTGVRLFFENLPFELTSAQKRAVKEIFADMQKDIPMMRLVQGDVGSGKTVLAAAAAYFAAKNGYQAAIMAPTEILAVQHYNTITRMLEKFDIPTALLTGGMTASQKKNAKAAILKGDVSVIIGTHAVIQSDVEFKNLALAVTDEQHRFGVIQRASLITKGEKDITPHTLVMSATPIPRTLSLILYGDLDLSVLDELPPGRKKIETYALEKRERDKINSVLRNEIKKGHQVFVVCPLVEESENLDAQSAEEKIEEIKADFPEYECALLHGKMKGKDKTRIMADFKAGKTKILVSTTVIEVGVDIPNATVMVIENAERFGLSTLHQLRGRIGRGADKSYCLLIYDKESKKSKERLETMCRTDNGFEIAEADLKLRGPGDFFGERQSGEIKFKVASIADLPLIEQTRACANVIIDKNLLLENDYSLINEESEKLYLSNLKRNIFN
jgi:ATP-dependent DNA helicase RecG